MDDALLVGVVVIAAVVLGVKAGAAEVSGCSDGGAVVAAFDDLDVEVGTGDWVSPPVGIRHPHLLLQVGMGICVNLLLVIHTRASWPLWIPPTASQTCRHHTIDQFPVRNSLSQCALVQAPKLGGIREGDQSVKRSLDRLAVCV